MSASLTVIYIGVKKSQILGFPLKSFNHRTDHVLIDLSFEWKILNGIKLDINNTVGRTCQLCHITSSVGIIGNKL